AKSTAAAARLRPRRDSSAALRLVGESGKNRQRFERRRRVDIDRRKSLDDRIRRGKETELIGRRRSPMSRRVRTVGQNWRLAAYQLFALEHGEHLAGARDHGLGQPCEPPDFDAVRT